MTQLQYCTVFIRCHTKYRLVYSYKYKYRYSSTRTSRSTVLIRSVAGENAFVLTFFFFLQSTNRWVALVNVLQKNASLDLSSVHPWKASNSSDRQSVAHFHTLELTVAYSCVSLFSFLAERCGVHLSYSQHRCIRVFKGRHALSTKH